MSKADTAPSLRGDFLQLASDAERENAPQHRIVSEEGRGADENITGVWLRVTQSDRVEQEGPQSLSREEPECKSLEKGQRFQQQRQAQTPSGSGALGGFVGAARSSSCLGGAGREARNQEAAHTSHPPACPGS